MDENQLKLLWRLHAEKNGGFKDYDEFKSLMANDKARKAYFDASNSDLGFKDYNEFQNVLSGSDKPQANNSTGGEKALQNLYSAVSNKLDIGDYDSFKSKMQTPENRKRFYNAVSDKGFDLGDYNSFEGRLSANKQTGPNEKYTSTIYNSLGGSAKFGAYSDFKDLIATNDEYRKQFYNQFGEKTLGAYSDFEDLVKKSPSDNGSNVSGNGSNPSPSDNQNTFDPAKFMQQSRSAVLSNKPAQDNRSTQAPIQRQLSQKRVQNIQTNQANAKKASPVTENEINAPATDTSPVTPDDRFHLIDQIKQDFPDVDPNTVIGNKDNLSGYFQQKNKMLQTHIDGLQNSELAGTKGAEIKQLKQQQADLISQSVHFLSIHAGMEGGGDPTKTGIILGKALGNPNAAQQERFIAKGIPVDPMQKVQTEQAGLDAQMATLQAQTQDKTDPKYIAQMQQLQQQRATVLQRNPEAYKQDWENKLGEYIGSKLSPLEINTGVYGKSLPDYLADFQKDTKTQIPPDVLKNITWPENLPKDFAGKLLSGFMGHFSDKAAGLERMGGSALGIDPDVLTNDIQQGQKNLATSFNLDNPASVAMESKINPAGAVMAGNIIKGIGGLSAFVLDATNEAKVASNILGKALPAMEDAKLASLSQHIGTDATVFAGAYEGNYQKAVQLIGDKPEDEGKRNLSAILGSSIDAAVFHLPIGKYGDALLEDGKDKVLDVLKDLPSDLKDLTSDNLNSTLKTYLQKPLAKLFDAAKNTTEEAAKFGSMQTAGILLKHISNSIVVDNDASSKDWENVPDEIKQTWASLPISLMPGIFGMNLLGAGKTSAFKKNAMFDAFSNPERTLSDLGKAQEAGLISPEEFKARSEVVQIGNKLLKEAPTESPETGQPLTHDQTVTWVANRLQETALEAKKAGVKDDKVLSKVYDDKIKGLQAEREFMIRSEAFKPKELKRVDIGPEISQDNVKSDVKADTTPDLVQPHVETIDTKESNVETPEKNRPDEIKVGEMIDKKGSYNGEHGTFSQDGRTVIFTPDKKNKEYEIGNIDEVKDKPISDFGIEHEESVVSTNAEGDISVRGETYKNKYSDPLAAINYDANGNVKSVNLETADGKKRTFRKNIAEDIAYQIHLKELYKNNENRNNFEQYINFDPATSTEINNGGFSETTTQKSVENNEKLSRQAIEPKPSGDEQAVTLESLPAEIKEAATKIPLDKAEEANTTGWTADNLPENLFNGDPYTQNDLTNLKNDLNERSSKASIDTKQKSEQPGVSNAETSQPGSAVKTETPNSGSTNKNDGSETGESEVNKDEVLKRQSAIARLTTEERKQYIQAKWEDKADEYLKNKGAEISDSDISNTSLQDSKNIGEYVSKAKTVLSELYPNAKLEVYDNTRDYKEAGGEYGTRGFAILDKNGNHKILLNLQQIKEDKSGKTAFHEVIHPIVYDAFGVHSDELIPLWNEVQDSMKNVKGMDKVFQHIANYDYDKIAPEGITETLTQIAAGNIDLKDVPKTVSNKIIDLVNRLFDTLGIKFKINSINDFGELAKKISDAFNNLDTSGLRDVVKSKNIDKYLIDLEKQLSEKDISWEDFKNKIDHLKSEGFTGEEIKDALKSKNLTDEQIKYISQKSEVNPEDYVSIKKAIVNQKREDSGKSALETSTGKTNEQRFNETKAKIESGEISVEHIRDIAHAIATDDDKMLTNLSASEIQHALIYDRNTLSNEAKEIEQKINEAHADKDEKSLADLQFKKAQNELLQEDNDLAAYKSGSELSNAFRARQIGLKQDYSLAALSRKYKAAGDGTIPDSVKAKFDEYAKIIESKEAKIAEIEKAKADADAEIAQLIELNKALKSKRENFKKLKDETSAEQKSSPKVETRETLRSEREQIKKSLQDKWIKFSRGQLNAGIPIPVEMIPDLVKLAKNYIKDGAITLDAMIDKVHEFVSDFMDVDKADLRDAISGYGKIKKPNPDITEKIFRDLTAQSRLVSSIERAMEQLAPLKSGAQRDEITKEIRALKKELNKALKDNNIQVVSPEKQMKTALDGAKTRLKNQIEDLTAAIDKNQKIVKDHSGINYDEEGKQLVSERDALRDQYDEIFGTNKELTDEQRLDRAEKAVQKGIEKLKERIDNNDVTQKKTPLLNSPELTRLRAEREGLQQTYKQLLETSGELDRRKLEALKKNIAKRTAYLEEIKKTGNVDKFLEDRKKKVTVLDSEGYKLKAEQRQAKNAVDNMVELRKFKQMSNFQQGLHWTGRLAKGVLISNPVILVRIAGSVVWRAAMKIPTETIKYGVSKAIPGLAKGAYTEAIRTKADLADHLAKYYSTLFSGDNAKGFVFAFKNHNTAEDLALGKDYHKLPIPVIKAINFKTFLQAGFFKTIALLDKNASLHGAVKSIASKPEFEAYKVTILKNLIREGVTAEDLEQPTLQAVVEQLALTKSLRAKFMQENKVVGAQRSVEDYFRRSDHPEVAEIINGVLPITKIASNYISEEFTKLPIVGMSMSLKQISAYAFGKGSKLTEAQKSGLLRTLTFQGVGLFTYALGWALHASFNPFYKSSATKYAQKKNEDDEDSGLMRAWETLSHSPDAMTFQAGVSHAWIWNKYDDEHPGEPSMSKFMGTLLPSLIENARNEATSSPYLQTDKTVIQPLITGKGLGKAAANFITARTPFYSILNDVAQGKAPIINKLGYKSDDEEKVKPSEIGLYPKSFWDNIGFGIPGWRERILKKLFDEKNNPAKKTIRQLHDAEDAKDEKEQKTEEFARAHGFNY